MGNQQSSFSSTTQQQCFFSPPQWWPQTKPSLLSSHDDDDDDEDNNKHKDTANEKQTTLSSCYSPPSEAKAELDYTPYELSLRDDVATDASNILVASDVWIVTTAALPWMTGTAVNPLLRAAYLCSNSNKHVHLVLPWLERPSDRCVLYGPEWECVSCDDQEAYIRNWLQHTVPSTTSQQHRLHIYWYDARYHAKLGSIFAMGDICETIINSQQQQQQKQKSICLLEEPEHLNYYRGGRWRQHFSHVCGICHTNYEWYSSSSNKNKWAKPFVGMVSAWMVRAYCDQVIHLSATLPSYAPEKEVVCNVHGVRPECLTQTYQKENVPVTELQTTTSQVYFLGKLLWAKGLDKLLELQQVYRATTGNFWKMDVYGSGPDQDEIEAAFTGHNSMHYLLYGKHVPLPVTFCGRLDHAQLDSRYKILVNPSLSEVLCTVTAEAIAMGKFVILPKHPSNSFFESFPNALFYQTSADFCQQLTFALHNDPPQPDTTSLTWEAATERLIEAVSISPRQAARRDRLWDRDQRLANWHLRLAGEGTTGDVVRTVFGGGPISKQSSVTSFGSRSSSRASLRQQETLPSMSCTSVGSLSQDDDDDDSTDGFIVTPLAADPLDVCHAAVSSAPTASTVTMEPLMI